MILAVLRCGAPGLGDAGHRGGVPVGRHGHALQQRKVCGARDPAGRHVTLLLACLTCMIRDRVWGAGAEAGGDVKEGEVQAITKGGRCSLAPLSAPSPSPPPHRPSLS
eukprot:1743928-Rhodomonas_salina.1